MQRIDTSLMIIQFRVALQALHKTKACAALRPEDMRQMRPVAEAHFAPAQMLDMSPINQN